VQHGRRGARYLLGRCSRTALLNAVDHEEIRTELLDEARLGPAGSEPIGAERRRGGLGPHEEQAGLACAVLDDRPAPRQRPAPPIAASAPPPEPARDRIPNARAPHTDRGSREDSQIVLDSCLNPRHRADPLPTPALASRRPGKPDDEAATLVVIIQV